MSLHDTLSREVWPGFPVVGEMAELVRAHDWSATPLGPIKAWPQSLRTAVEIMLGSRQPVYVAWGPELTSLYNDGYIPILGAKHPAGLGQSYDELWSEIRDEYREVINAVMAGEAQHFVDRPVTLGRRDGVEVGYFTFSWTPLRDEAGVIRGFICNGLETTERVEAGRAFRRMFEASPTPFLVLAPDAPRFTIVEVNDAYLAAVMRTREELLGRGVFEAMPDNPADSAATGVTNLRASLERAITNGCPDAMPRQKYDIAHPSGGFEERWWDPVNSPLLGEHGEVEALIHHVVDVTEQHRAQERLRDSEAKLRAVIEEAPLAMALTGASGEILLRNPHFDNLWGRPPQMTTAQTYSEVYEGYHLDGRPIASEEWPGARAVLKGDVVENDVYEIVQANGRRITCWFGAAPIRNASGEIVGAVVVFRDISEERRTEAKLRELNETLESQVVARTAELRRYQDIIEATTAPICAFDTTYRLIALNKAQNDEFRRVNGFDTKLGDVLPDLFMPEQASLMRALMTRALSGESFTVVEKFGRPELGTPWWEISYTPLRDEDGSVVGAFHHALDISDRLRAEAELASAQEALRQSQKLESMGQLTGGVAHDFNNLLTPIIGALDLLQRVEVGGEREQRLIAGAAQSAERAKTLVQRLLAFARRQPLQPVPVDLGKLVVGMADLIGSTSGPRVKVALDVTPGLPAVTADPNQIEMAILNLAVNARDAMRDGGALTIAAKPEAVGPSHRSGLRAGHYVRLSVSDTGAGMDPETTRRAIEPFFSTKGVGRGTGLGLSMVHGLAAQLGGAMTIQSLRDVGTTVELWLPVASASAFSSESVSRAVKVAASGTALLVDDEELVRASTADMLSDLGYAVVEADSAEEALRLLNDGLAPDVVVTDHLMPGMTGTDLAHALKGRSPAPKVLIISGYAEDEGIAPDIPRLTKPFRQADLSASLAELFQSGI